MNKKSLSTTGFTLIELLIVIALLGALAVGMLAAIDPLEQFKKGNDTSTRNTVEELYTAFTRYYAINSSFPFGASLGASAASAVTSYIQSIITAGELKASFLDSSMARLGKITLSGSTDKFTVCYAPDSKMMRNDVNTQYTNAGVTVAGAATACTGKMASTGNTVCYWCMQ